MKNAVCFAALVFAGRLDRPTAVALATVTFVAFCLASSAVYVLNDVVDRAEDRAHPVKRRRALAAGRISPGTALAESALLAAAALAVSLALVPRARVVVATYLVLQVAYSLVLKRVAIVDVMAIAVGFVLRVQAGIEAIGSPQSAWILLTMFFVALLLGFGKRRSELAQLPDEARGRRPVLGAYSVALLDLVLGMSATTALLCYALYAVTVQTEETFLLTVLPVTFGILRYLMLVLVRERGEDPDELVTRDGPLVVAILAWAALTIAVLYFGLRLVPG